MRHSQYTVNIGEFLESAKVFIPLELFHILSRYDHKHKYILLEFYVKDQHKLTYNCEVERKLYMIFIYFFTNKKLKSVVCKSIQPP